MPREVLFLMSEIYAKENILINSIFNHSKISVYQSINNQSLCMVTLDSLIYT
jgi:hypothetical protein